MRITAVMAALTAVGLALAVGFVLLSGVPDSPLRHYAIGDWAMVLLAAIITPHLVSVARFDRWLVRQATPTTVGARR